MLEIVGWMWVWQAAHAQPLTCLVTSYVQLFRWWWEKDQLLILSKSDEFNQLSGLAEWQVVWLRRVSDVECRPFLISINSLGFSCLINALCAILNRGDFWQGFAYPKVAMSAILVMEQGLLYKCLVWFWGTSPSMCWVTCTTHGFATLSDGCYLLDLWYVQLSLRNTAFLSEETCKCTESVKLAWNKDNLQLHSDSLLDCSMVHSVLGTRALNTDREHLYTCVSDHKRNLSIKGLHEHTILTS